MLKEEIQREEDRRAWREYKEKHVYGPRRAAEAAQEAAEKVAKEAAKEAAAVRKREAKALKLQAQEAKRQPTKRARK